MALDLRNQQVLVTGASGGLGRAMALRLARDYGAQVIAVARRQEALEALAKEASEGVVEPIACDLADLEASRALAKQLSARPLRAAILNAGITLTGPFADQTQADLEALIALNVTSTTLLARQLIAPLEAGAGALMLVASLGGLTPLPYQAAYGATKAYLVNLGYGLAEEMAGSGVSVTICAPGGIATPMTQSPAFASQQRHLMPADLVAEKALGAMVNRKTLVIPGRQNKLMAAAIKVLPRRWVTAITERQFRRDMA